MARIGLFTKGTYGGVRAYPKRLSLVGTSRRTFELTRIRHDGNQSSLWNTLHQNIDDTNTQLFVRAAACNDFWQSAQHIDSLIRVPISNLSQLGGCVRQLGERWRFIRLRHDTQSLVNQTECGLADHKVVADCNIELVFPEALVENRVPRVNQSDDF
jgi:hypothetical protein